MDLSIGIDGQPEEEIEIGVEFKLIHNNKNWRDKVREVHRDLHPSKPPKSKLRSRLGWLAVVGFIGKQYAGKPCWSYPKVDQDVATWEKKVLTSLYQERTGAGQRVVPATRTAAGRRHPFQSDELTLNGPHFFQLRVLKPG